MKRSRVKIVSIGISAMIIFIGIVMLIPLIWTVSTSLKLDPDIGRSPMSLIPPVVDWANYPEAFEIVGLWRKLFNSTVVTVMIMFFNLVFCAMSGYAFARLRFPGRDVLFLFLLFTMSLPVACAVLPIFVFLRGLPLVGGNNIYGTGGHGLINTYPGLIFGPAITVFGVFLSRQAFLRLPKELEDAGRIDGCSEWAIFWRISLPQVKAVLGALAIFSFLWGWNDFLWPLVCIKSENMKTIQLVLLSFMQQWTYDWAHLLAATIVAISPPIVIFLWFQRYFVKGLSLGGLKA